MGILDSLAAVLPYAIPAAAGAALGGPGLGMVGAGGAAQAQSGALDQQMRLAQLMSESQYRNSELGLRKQEIEGNEKLREQQASAEQVYRAEMLQEKKEGRAEHGQEHQESLDSLNAYRTTTTQLAQQGRQLQAAQLAATQQHEKDQLAQQYKENLRARIAQAEALGVSASKEAAGNTTAWQNYVGKGKQAIGDAAHDKAYADSIRAQGITKEELQQLGTDPVLINEIYPPPTTRAPSAASAKLKAAGKGAAAPAVPQMVNGRKVVQVPKSADYPTGLKYVN